jgi:hypothetical protein
LGNPRENRGDSRVTGKIGLHKTSDTIRRTAKNMQCAEI